MTESIGTARLDVVVGTQGVDAGVAKFTTATRDMSKAAQDASAKMDQGTKRQVQALERQIATLGKSRSEVIRWRIEQQTSGRVAAELTAKLDAQSKKLSAVSATMNKVGGAAKAAVVGWASLLAASVSVGAAFAGIKNSIDFADKLNDLNQRLGISAEALSGWAYAAKQTGTDIDALGVGMKKLAKNMAEALDPKSAQANLFSALGVSVKDAKGNLRSLEDVLPEVADGFKGIKNETLKLALAQELLGKSGSDLIEFFNQGADGLGAMRDRARELGIELSQGTLSGADQFNDKLADLKTVSAALFTQIAAELLPSLTKLVDKLTELAQEGNESGSVIKWIGDQAEAAAKDFDFFTRSVSDFSDMFREVKIQAASTLGLLTSIAQLDFRGAAGSFGALMGARDRSLSLLKDGSQPKSQTPDVRVPGLDFSLPGTRPAFSAVPLGGVGVTAPDREAAVNRALAEGRTGGGKAKKEGKSDAEREIERLEAAYKSFAAQQRERIDLFGVESEAVKVRYELEHGELSKLTDAQAKKLGINKDELIANAEKLDQLREEAEVQRDLDKIDKTRNDRAKDVLDDIRTETLLLGKSAEAQDTWNKLKYAGKDASEEYKQAIIEENHVLHESAMAVARQTELMDTFRTEASDAIADVVTGTKSLSDAFKDMFDNIAERITQMIADRWIEQLFGQMGTTQGGSSGDWFGQLFGLFSGMGGGWSGAGGPGWSEGGYTGAGGTLEPAGVVHKGEVVWSQRDISRAGGVAVVEGMRQGLRGYESGGVVGMRVMAGGGNVTNAPVLNQTFVVQGTPDNRTREQMARSSGREAARGIARTGR